MSSHFILRMQFGPHQEMGRLTHQVMRLVGEAPIDEVALFLFAEELNNGHETLDEIREWLAAIRPLGRHLREAGVAVSLNPWHSVLHADRGRKLKQGQGWQPMVDPNGREAQAVVCPLDPAWRAYYREAMRLYSAEGFRVIWIDDDIRYHNHAPLEWGGCFCPLHVRAFQARIGLPATREEIVAACTAPGEPHPWREIWMDLWDDQALAMIGEWRTIAEAGGSQLGLMSSDLEAHAAEGRRWAGWWSSLGGGRPPVHRPHFWTYGDTVGSELPYAMAKLEQSLSVQPAATESAPEIECFPYGRWNKSFRQTGAQMALAHVLGVSGLNISLYDFMGNDPEDEPERADFLRRWRPVCDWLSETFPSPSRFRPVGVGIPWSEGMGRRTHTGRSGGWQGLHCPSRGWAGWLGAAGCAFTTQPAPRVNALAGKVAWAFTHEEVLDWLHRGLLLDGEAAAILVERGFGDLIGLSSPGFVSQDDRLYAIENCIDADFALRVGAQMSLNATPSAGRLMQGTLDPAARIVSELVGPKQEPCGHGAYVFTNSRGGRVAVVPWHANSAVTMNAQRRAQLAALVGWAAGEGATGGVTGGPWLVPQFLTDGRTWRGVVWNASPDDVERLAVQLPDGMSLPASAVQVRATGERMSFAVTSPRIELPVPLAQWEFIVLLPQE